MFYIFKLCDNSNVSFDANYFASNFTLELSHNLNVWNIYNIAFIPFEHMEIFKIGSGNIASPDIVFFFPFNQYQS